MAVRKSLLSLACLLLLLSPAAAGEHLVETRGATLRLATEPPTEDGSLRGALLIDLEPGWKTYWIDPGEAGLAPEFDFSRSVGITGVDIRFPAPEHFIDADLVSNGYTGSVVLPFEASVSDALEARVELSFLIGLCKDICVPFSAALSAPVEDPPSLDDAMAIDRAFLSLPRDGGAVLAGVLEDERLIVEMPQDGQAEALFVSGTHGWRFGPAASRTPGRFEVPVLHRTPERPHLFAIATGARAERFSIDIR